MSERTINLCDEIENHMRGLSIDTDSQAYITIVLDGTKMITGIEGRLTNISYMLVKAGLNEPDLGRAIQAAAAYIAEHADDNIEAQQPQNSTGDEDND